MALAIFDLDNTLLAGDSDYLWGEFLVQKKLVDVEWFAKENQRFLEEYNEGCLDINEWINFQFTPLKDNKIEDLTKWHKEFLETVIKPIVLPKGLASIKYHRERGDTLLIITATNSFVTRPIADLFAIETLIATTPEMTNNQYTGKTVGTITFKEGKITALKEWLAKNNLSCEDCWFYSDSHNDIPLLSHVAHPIAVDPDAQLRQKATESNWKITTFRP